jgi:hypothetical protein
MKKLSFLKCLIVVTGLIQIVSCATVKEYQKSRINDAEMSMANRKVEKTEINVVLYKEGSSGANGGRAGGGCGCN